MTYNPFIIEFTGNSSIRGFTTGASSGSGGASIRGQRADHIYMDEVDYMHESDFDTITTIAAERPDIGIYMSSTPTGQRGRFYDACMNKNMGYKEFYHPSTHNPAWTDEMEAEMRAQLSDNGYIHEIMAEFGEQEMGVFNKARLDEATKFDYYAYEELNYFQKEALAKQGISPKYYIYNEERRAAFNPFRTMGIDWDKYGAGSSIVILDYDVNFGKFRVLKRTEIPKGEYSYDNAVKKIIEYNNIYNPSWIYADRGSGEYQIERLHIIGAETRNGMDFKVKGFQFKENIDIMDPITKEVTKEPFKQVMVNQLQIGFERGMVMLSPFDEDLYKQLIDYEVEKISASGLPIFSKKNEHYIDALGLAYIAFVLEFPDIVRTIKDVTPNMANIKESHKKLGEARYKNLWNSINSGFDSGPEKARLGPNVDLSEPRGERETWVKVPLGVGAKKKSSGGFSRGAGTGGRRMW